MKKSIALALCVILVMVTISVYGADALIPDQWTSSDMGAGGWWNGIEAGIDGTILLNSDLSGSYISYDQGKSWTCIGESNGLFSTHSSGMGFDPTDADIIFIGSAGGIYRSEDKGKNFVKVLDKGFCTDIAISRSEHNIGYAAVTSAHNTTDGKIYKTADNGRTWMQLNSNLPESGIMIQEIYVDPTNSNQLYMHSYNGRFVTTASPKLYKSLDGGITWTELGEEMISGKVFDFVVDPADFDTVYASGNGVTEGDNKDILGIKKSTDGGATWTTLTNAGVSGAMHIKREEGLSDATIRVFGSWRYWISTDSGASWTTYNISELDFSPGLYFWTATDTRKCDSMYSSDTIFWCNTAWVWKWNAETNTVEASWSDVKTVNGETMYRGRGIHNTNLHDIEISDANSNVVYASYADMGLWRSLDHGQSWQSCNNTEIGSWASPIKDSKMGAGGTSRTVEADPEKENVVWAGLSNGLYKSTNYGRFDSWTICNGLPNTNESAVTALVVSPSSNKESRTLYAISDGVVYKSIDGGANFTSMSNSFAATCLAVDTNDSEILYVGSQTGIYKLDNGNFIKIECSDLTGVSDIVCSPVKSGSIYVTCLGEGKGLYKSSDYGNSWTKLLTDKYMRSVAVNPKDEMNIFTASSYADSSGGYSVDSKGIQVTYDGGNTWTEVNEGLAWRSAWKIAIDSQNPERVVMATRGLGVQQRNFRVTPAIYNPETNYEYKSTEDIPENGKLEIYIPIPYTKGIADKDAVLLVGEYCGSVMKKVYINNQLSFENGVKAEITLEKPNKTSIYKFFLWTGEICPLCEVFSLQPKSL